MKGATFLRLLTDNGKPARFELDRDVGLWRQSLFDRRIDYEKLAVFGLDFILDMIAEIGRMRDTSGKPPPAFGCKVTALGRIASCAGPGRALRAVTR